MNVETARQLAHKKLEALAEELARGRSDTLKRYLAAMARFPQYSAHNVWLILAQRPSAVRVAGYTTWLRLGRQVKRGARAIRILAPVLRRRENSTDSNGQGQRDDVIGFRAACVFDGAETEGAPLAEPACVCGDPGIYFERLTEAIAERGILLTYSSALGAAHGLSTRNRIVLRPDLAPAERFSTAVHELAHIRLGHHTSGNPTASAGLHEVESESVAYVVCQAIGLDTNSSSSDYVLAWGGDAKSLAASLERIQRVACEIIAAIGPDI